MCMLSYRKNQLYAENILLENIVKKFHTPCYVYSRAAIEKQWLSLDTALIKQNHLICYAVKANSNIAVLNILARLGSGFDIVSEGELERVLKSGGSADKIVFSGVGKTTRAMRRALEVGIKCFNIESLAELTALDKLAGEMGMRAPISLRINPNIDANTHPYIATGMKENKFGIAFTEAITMYQYADTMANIETIGIGCHIGSQILTMDPLLNALDLLLELTDKITKIGITLKHINIGGGLGIHYQDENPPSMEQYAQKLCEKMQDVPYKLLLEPGRSIVGNAGILITEVIYLKCTKNKNFAIIDAAMNDLLRPSLYGAKHKVMQLNKPENIEKTVHYDLVGPICESSDFLAKDCPLNIKPGDILAIGSVGAYGFSMASTYNSRPKICEIMLNNGMAYEIRRRQTIAELMDTETILPSDP